MARDRAREWHRPAVGLAAAMACTMVHALMPSYPQGAAYVNNPANFTASTVAIREALGRFGGASSGGGGCSGVAIDTDLVLTAAHCFQSGQFNLVSHSSSFAVSVPAATYRVGLAQGRTDLIEQGSEWTAWAGTRDVSRGAGATAFGRIQAVAVVSAGGPDLALVRVTQDDPNRLEPFQTARLISSNETPLLSAVAQEQQNPPGTVLLDARAEGYSRTQLGGLLPAAQQLSGAKMLVEPNLVSFPSEGGIWQNRGFAQSETFVRYYLDEPANPVTGAYNTAIQFHGRIIDGDSGGPLYGFVGSSIEQRVVGIAVGIGRQQPMNTYWASVAEYETLIGDMATALRGLPAPGTTRTVPYIPQGVHEQGDSIRNTFAIRLNFQPGWRYFDPLAGLTELLEVNGATQGITGLDLAGLLGAATRIYYRDASGLFHPLSFQAQANGQVLFSSPHSALRVSGLDVAPGTPIVIGLRFADLSLGVVNVAWTNEGVLAAIPEPPKTAMLLAGLGAFAWLARRRRP
jgi:hypothetical protein